MLGCRNDKNAEKLTVQFVAAVLAKILKTSVQTVSHGYNILSLDLFCITV